MDPLYLFLIQVGFTVLLMSLAATWWAMPRLRQIPINHALSIVLFGGAIRYMGTMLLHPALAPTPHPDVIAAWGDVAVASVAIAGIFANRAGSALGRPLAWIYAVVGGVDMLMAFVKGLQTGSWAALTGGWTFVVTAFPVVGVTLVMTFILLLKPAPAVARAAAPLAA